MKKFISVFALILVCAMLLVGCGKSEKNDAPETTDAPETQKAVDYSRYEFTDVSWTRTTEYDTETLRFRSNGGFSYYCACGNPVNDSDMCEGYTYDDETKTVTLNCFETSEEMVTVIKIVKCEGGELHLDFNGEIRVFTKE